MAAALGLLTVFAVLLLSSPLPACKARHLRSEDVNVHASGAPRYEHQLHPLLSVVQGLQDQTTGTAAQPSGEGRKLMADDESSVRAQLAQLPPGGTLQLPTFLELNNPLVITVAFARIRGSAGGSFVSCGRGGATAFIIAAQNVIMRDVNVQGCGNTSVIVSSPLSASGATLVIDSCSFQSNRGVVGAAVRVEGDGRTTKLTLRSSSFTGNTVSLYGGAVAALNTSAVAISNCTFVNNFAAAGGAVYLVQSTATVDDSVFNFNYANQAAAAAQVGLAGGAIFITGAVQPTDVRLLGSLRVQGCTFLANFATSLGGAIVVFRLPGESVAIVGSRFDSNAAGDFRFAYQGAVASAAAIYAFLGMESNGGPMRLTDLYFLGHSANTFAGCILLRAGAMSLTRCTFQFQRASDSGGVIMADGIGLSPTQPGWQYVALKLDSCVMADMYVGDKGGAIYLYQGNGDQPTPAARSDGVPLLDMRNCTVVRSQGTAGAITHWFSRQDAPPPPMGNISIIDSEFSENTQVCNLGILKSCAPGVAGRQGSGLVIVGRGYDSIVTVRRTSFHDNVFAPQGSALILVSDTGYFPSPRLQVDGCMINNNNIDCSDYTCTFSGDDSNVLRYNIGGANQTAFAAYPQLYNYPAGPYLKARGVINNSTFKDNFVNAGAVVSVGFTTVGSSRNSIQLAHARLPFSLTVSRCLFATNLAVSSPRGGALNLALTTRVDLTDTIFDSNTAGGLRPGSGAAVSLASPLGNVLIRNCVFSSNTARDGDDNPQPPPNDDPASGGALELYHVNCLSGNPNTCLPVNPDGNTVTVDNCTFSNNHAEQGGGAIVALDLGLYNTRLAAWNTVFTGNSAQQGGAVQLKQNMLPTLFRRVSFTSNAADVEGGAVWQSGPGFSCNGCTFVDNFVSPDVFTAA